MAEPNFQNRTLYHGDNLDFLRGMNSETVHLIATDPPFKKGKDFHATPDSLAAGARFRDRWSWERDVHVEWTDSIKDDWPAVWEVIDAARAAYGDDMGAFLCWLGVRLMEMHRVLRPDGSIYLHIDHTAHAYVKCLMDAIFGWKNFRNEIIWCYSHGGKSAKYFGKKHDTILFYSKSGTWTFNAKDVRIPMKSGKSSFGGRLETDDDGRRYRLVYGTKNAKGETHYYKYYLDEGKLPEDYWTDINSLQSGVAERTGYPTQKPLALYRRIIEASSNEGDFVLDPFCGCATTPVAAERQKRRWVGMDIWDGAKDIVLQRLAEEGMVTPDSDHGLMFPYEVHYETTTPERTDDNEIAAPTLRLRIRRPVAPWQKISHSGMMNVLAAAQGSGDGVICGGCGRVLEREFMQLDHITPKSDRGTNDILNRILLCGPCNRRKRDNLTLRGLLRENKKKAVGWMNDEGRAKLAQDSARDKAEWVRDDFDSPECQALIDGRSSPN